MDKNQKECICMTKTEVKELIGLYNLYGFETGMCNDDYLVFTYTNGYFSNAEIIKINDTDVSQVQNEFENAGYSVRIREGKDIETAHENLFKGFFSIEATKRRITSEYQNYCNEQQSKLLSSKYEYLDCDYYSGEEHGESRLVDYVFSKLNSDQPQLVILEAAAGYGKTCTSFEILNRFSGALVNKVPMMTELSRNRKASVFRYVLLSEIDARFPSLSQKIVEYEIRKGNVPLIVDGFDELLSKSIESVSNGDDSFEETKGMLDTIVELLKHDSKAKILITSRKSAIFAGEKFDDWVECHDLGSIITRIVINAPSVVKWLGNEKINILKNNGVNSTLLSNPIILSIMKNETIESIKVKSIDQILDGYFATILQRERERQNLLLSIDDQMTVLTQIAGKLAENDITADEPEMILLVIEEAIRDQLKSYISRYSDASIIDTAETIPDEEEFCMKLVHHALLDRVSLGKNRIGFINDFLFGFFLGQAVIRGILSIENNMDYRYVDLICTAYMIDNMKGKSVLEQSVETVIDNYSIIQQLGIQNRMFHSLRLNYADQTISGIEFNCGFVFGQGHGFINCIFYDCVFDGCFFGETAFNDCQFYNCKFYEPKFITETISESANLVFLGCSGHESIAQRYAMNNVNDEIEPENYERIVLEQFWKIGRDAPEKRRAFTTIKKGINPKYMHLADAALTSLIQKGIIHKQSVCYELDFTKLSDIKAILGRL